MDYYGVLRFLSLVFISRCERENFDIRRSRAISNFPPQLDINMRIQHDMLFLIYQKTN